MRYFRHITGKVSKFGIYEILLQINNKSKTKNEFEEKIQIADKHRKISPVLLEARNNVFI